MNQDLFEHLLTKVQEDVEHYRDTLRIGGILYKYGNPGIDIFPSSLTPYSMKASQYELIQKCQSLWQRLLFLVSQNQAFLNQILSITAKHDQFVDRLLKLYNETFDYKQQTQLSVFRIDYLKDGNSGKWGLVQFNTCAAANGALTQRLQKIMNKLYLFGNLKEFIHNEKTNLPMSLGFYKILDLMFKAYQQYGNDKAIILIVAENGEKNIYDHSYILQYLQNKGAMCWIISLQKAVKHTKCKQQKVFYEGYEVALLYFRSASNLKQFDQNTWQFRKNIQLTKAIKVPTIPMLLVNFKRVQVQLCKKQIMQKYLTISQVKLLQEVNRCGIDLEHIQNYSHFLKNLECKKYVLKPNKQGGGNNLYDNQILSTLQQCGPQKCKMYVLMERIEPFVKKTVQCKLNSVQLIQSTTEYGQFGGIMIKDGKIVEEAVGGALIRTKPASAKQGGIAKGEGGLDTLVIDYSQQ